jgi:hypothetical protein
MNLMRASLPESAHWHHNYSYVFCKFLTPVTSMSSVPYGIVVEHYVCVSQNFVIRFVLECVFWIDLYNQIDLRIHTVILLS